MDEGGEMKERRWWNKREAEEEAQAPVGRWALGVGRNSDLELKHVMRMKKAEMPRQESRVERKKHVMMELTKVVSSFLELSGSPADTAIQRLAVCLFSSQLLIGTASTD